MRSVAFVLRGVLYFASVGRGAAGAGRGEQGRGWGSEVARVRSGDERVMNELSIVGRELAETENEQKEKPPFPRESPGE